MRLPPARARTIRRTLERAITTRLFGHQRDMLDAILGNRKTAILGSRQMGKTEVLAIVAIMLGMGTTWRRRDGSVWTVPAGDVHIVCKGQINSNDIVRRIRKWLRTLDSGVSRARKAKDSVTDTRMGSMERIALFNGRYIYAHAGTADAIQGFPGHVIVDEIGASMVQEEIFTQALACASSRPDYHVAVVGNASPKGDFWCEFWTDKSRKWHRRRGPWAMKRYTVHDVHPGGLPAHIEDIERTMGAREWERWYLCRFVDALNRALGDHLLDAAQTGSYRAPVEAPLILSIDPGGHVNPTGVALCRPGDYAMDVLRAEYWYGPRSRSEGQHDSWVHAQMERVGQYMREHDIRRIIVDGTNPTDLLTRALKKRYGGRVTVITVTPDSRQRNWEALRALMIDGRISIPKGEAGGDCRSDLGRLELDQSVRYHRSYQFGRIHTPSVSADNGHHVLHCDISCAIMMATDYVSWEKAAAFKRPDLSRRDAPAMGGLIETLGVAAPVKETARSRNRRRIRI